MAFLLGWDISLCKNRYLENWRIGVAFRLSLIKWNANCSAAFKRHEFSAPSVKKYTHKMLKVESI